ncbi:hypothetical protein ABNX05_17980 [Lysinibacillus sp. M3]|uniref:Transcriptional regulator n=1 Tax=Lysinibacillus zambalensis TaxID=3160866 RepID=A0ABV1MVH8_9BACI
MTRTTARQKVLEALQNTPSGLTNNELIKISPSFRARLSELYEEGHIIEKTPLQNGVNLYRYKGFEKKELKDAYSSLVHVLYENGHKDVVEKLSTILEEANVVLHRKTLK